MRRCAEPRRAPHSAEPSPPARRALDPMTRQPRLLMLLHGYYPDEPRVLAEATAAVGAGFEVDILTLRRPGGQGVKDVDGVRCIELPIQHRRGAGVATVLGEYLGFTVLATAK